QGRQSLGDLIRNQPRNLRNELSDDLIRAFFEQARASAEERAARRKASRSTPATAAAADAAAANALMNMADATQRLAAVLRAPAWSRAEALLGPGHELNHRQAITAMGMIDL